MIYSIKVRDIYESGNWEKACNVLGLNVWAINEGLIDMDDKLAFDEEEYEQYGE